MTRLVFAVEYDGSAFKGWQWQPGLRTVQETVESALSRVASQTIRITCAGRTDVGVHATGQIIHFDTPVERPEHAWLFGGNSTLPADVSLRWCIDVGDNFDARRSALARTYRYVILNRRLRSALQRQRAVWICQPLDAGNMHEAAQVLCGEHDFSAFRAAGCQSKTPFRRIDEIKVQRRGDYLYIDITANAFLHNMVRIIVGALLSVGRNERPPEWIAELLRIGDRRLAAMTAPAHGLYLVKVSYPNQFGLPQQTVWPSF